jgi:hypothetical protein
VFVPIGKIESMERMEKGLRRNRIERRARREECGRRKE